MISGFLKRKCSGQKGFTLIEMSAVLLILGLLVAAGGRLYTQWLEFKAVEDTRTDITTANLALQNFLETYGRYPCPAGLTIDRDDPDYGRETDCADTSVAVGGTGTVDGKADAYYVVASQRAAVTYKSRSTGTDTTEVPRIRIGALPFRMLGLEEEEAYDGWRRRLMYAVTENLGVSDIFEPEDGGVTIWNDQNASMTAEPDAAHFIVFSYGENGIGGYNYAGGRVPCAVAGPEETINCNIDTDAIFKIAAMNTSGGASHNDDMFVFSQADIPLWQLADGNPEDGVNKGTKTGVGAVASDNPNEELTVDGTVRAFDDPSTPAEEGNILSNSLCDHASATTDCFPSSLIAGSLSPPQPQHGMECPPGEFMVGIKNAAPICVDEVKATCPAGLVMLGFTANGGIDCGAPPNPCPPRDVVLCGGTSVEQSFTLPEAYPVNVRWLSAGSSFRQQWVCTDWSGRVPPKWVPNGSTGVCECNPDTWTGPQDCKASSDCGDRFSGTKTVQSTRACPSGTVTTVDLNTSTCTCLSTTGTKTENCRDVAGYEGYNDGTILFKNTHDCTASPPACSGWIPTDTSGCKCIDTVQPQTATCPTGFPTPLAQYKVKDSGWECKNGIDQPGKQVDTPTDPSDPDSYQNKCVCTPDNNITEFPCTDIAPGWTGTYNKISYLTCPGGPSNPGTWSKAVPVTGDVAGSIDKCTPPTCSWNLYNEVDPPQSGSSQSFKEGFDCTSTRWCGSGDPVACETNSGLLGICRCEVD